MTFLWVVMSSFSCAMNVYAALEGYHSTQPVSFVVGVFLGGIFTFAALHSMLDEVVAGVTKNAGVTISNPKSD